MIKNKNFRGQATPSIIDTEYRNCNFSTQNCIDVGGVKKGMRLFPGDDTPRTFISCNLVNCEPPPGSTIKGCNTAIKEDAVEVSSGDLEIDGDVIKVKNYANICYGRYKDGEYVYKTPIQVSCEALEE